MELNELVLTSGCKQSSSMYALVSIGNNEDPYRQPVKLDRFARTVTTIHIVLWGTAGRP